MGIAGCLASMNTLHGLARKQVHGDKTIQSRST
jgi:hypothetical protein